MNSLLEEKGLLKSLMIYLDEKILGLQPILHKISQLFEANCEW